MARSRNIKPGFFTNDLLGEMDPLARLLFAGLWTICDRDGRVEDRPKKIKAEVLPYDNCDPENLLQQLADKGFILRYKADGVSAIQVLAWEKHQSPHIKESPSTIPAPDMHGASTRQAPESIRKEPEQPGNRPDDCQPIPALAHLIPDSGFLIPDSKGSRAKRAPPPPRPEDVPQQVWDDWVQLRKDKRANVSATAVEEARKEASKAGMSLEAFLRVWLRRGSQGLEASWLKPEERQKEPQDAKQSQEYLRDLREHSEAAKASKPPAELLALVARIGK
jgi:hypothetical protein